jgi:hypothetical protein
MAHQVQFFCKSAVSNAEEALDQFLDALAAQGEEVEVLDRDASPGWSVCELATKRQARGTASLTVEFSTGKEEVSSAIARVASEPKGEGVRGSDMVVTLTLSGPADEKLVQSVRASLQELWHGVPYDEMTGFDV